MTSPPDVPLLMIEDDPAFRRSLSQVLAPEGLAVTGVGSVVEALALPPEFVPAAVLLDIDLPDMSGLQALPLIVRRFDARIFVISAMTATDNRREAILGGAEFFFQKPVDFDELRLVLRNQLLQRKAGAWRLIRQDMSLHSPGGQTIRLSGTEYMILRSFEASDDLVASRKELLRAAGRDGTDSKDRAIDLLITRLRRKCSDLGEPLPIRSIRGQGYVFCAELTFA